MTPMKLLPRRFAVALICAAGLTGTTIAADADEGTMLEEQARIEVFKPDGSRQCEPDSATPPAAMRAELQAAGITVYGARSASDGMMYIQVCGAPTGRIHVFSIDSAALDQARALGFQPLGARP